MFWIIKIVLLTQVASTHGLFHEGVLDGGFCHLQDVELDWDVACRSYLNVSVRFSVVARENKSNETELSSCRRPSNQAWICVPSELMSATYDSFNDTLKIKFTFNNSIYGGHLLRSKTSCNGKSKIEHFLLKACLSGFSANSTLYNDVAVIIYCQHTSFNSSVSPMRIKLIGKEEEYGHCFPNSCPDKGCNTIPNGVKCTLPYTYWNMYQCILDGAIFNISKRTIPGITQTSSESSSVPQTTATTPVKGSLSIMSITASKETLPTSSYHDITRTTQSSSTSKSPIVSPADMSPSHENIESATSLSSSSEIDATSTNPNSETSGKQTPLRKSRTVSIIAALCLLQIYIYYYIFS